MPLSRVVVETVKLLEVGAKVIRLGTKENTRVDKVLSTTSDGTDIGPASLRARVGVVDVAIEDVS